MLARARRSVLVIDSGHPRNAPASGVHGLLGLDGTPPGELLERGRAEVRRYGGEVLSDEVVTAAKDGAGFQVTLAGGGTVGARRLLVTTGLVDALPDVPGVRERWGKDVLHCPYCHGWEVRDSAIGVLATDSRALHLTQLFRQWSDDIVLFCNEQAPPGGEEAEKLAARGIRVVEGEVTALEIAGDRLVGVRLKDGSVVARDALAVSTRMVARAGFLSSLGLHPEEHPSGMGEHIRVDATGRTEVAGVWAAGNVADIAAQVGAAAAQGAFAAAQINFDLVNEDTELAVLAQREGAAAVR